MHCCFSCSSWHSSAHKEGCNSTGLHEGPTLRVSGDTRHAVTSPHSIVLQQQQQQQQQHSNSSSTIPLPCYDRRTAATIMAASSMPKLVPVLCWHIYSCVTFQIIISASISLYCQGPQPSCCLQDAEAVVLEPNKCRGWYWVEWGKLPGPLFKPLQQLVDHGYVPAGWQSK
jgi:hypothetical protein